MTETLVIDHLDHLVLTTAHEIECVRFYTDVLGMQLESFVGGAPPVERRAFRVGNQKINLHIKGREFEPKATRPTPGSADLCFVTASPIADVVATLELRGVPIEEGPVPRAGAQGPMTSVYLRDPDGNLLEVASYADAPGDAGGG